MIENTRSAPSIPPFCVCGRVTARMSFAAAGQLVGVKTPARTVPPTFALESRRETRHVIEARAFTAPVFANGRVYVRNTVGDVVSLDLTGK